MGSKGIKHDPLIRRNAKDSLGILYTPGCLKPYFLVELISYTYSTNILLAVLLLTDSTSMQFADIQPSILCLTRPDKLVMWCTV
jgi:hypothetical protein